MDPVGGWENINIKRLNSVIGCRLNLKKSKLVFSQRASVNYIIAPAVLALQVKGHFTAKEVKMFAEWAPKKELFQRKKVHEKWWHYRRRFEEFFEEGLVIIQYNKHYTYTILM